MANGIQITLIGKPGCHLCEDARSALSTVVQRFESQPNNPPIQVSELNILEDAQLAAKHSEEIPVLLVNGKMFGYWRIDVPRLEAHLAQLAKETLLASETTVGGNA